MGLAIYMCDLIIQEHLHRPLPSTVYTIGRPYMGFDYPTLLRLLDKHGLKPKSDKIEYDTFTTEAKQQIGKTDKRFISDRTFFWSLGVENVATIDVSPYEGAELILDLNKPIADRFESNLDFIVGCSTLDNVFNPAQYMRNMARLLRVGGRMIDINISVDFGRPYVILPVPWYFDFFVVNRFFDAKLYVQLYADGLHYYVVDCPDRELSMGGIGILDNFDSRSFISGIAFVAEKGAETSWDAIPIQDAWRGFEESVNFMRNLRYMRASPRPFLSGFLEDVPPVMMGPDRPNDHYRYLGRFDFGLYQDIVEDERRRNEKGVAERLEKAER